MAIINSVATGQAKKSTGNVTFATVNGRTIMKQKIENNTSNTKAQQRERNAFAVMSHAGSELREIIKYGYARIGWSAASTRWMSDNADLKEWVRQKGITRQMHGSVGEMLLEALTEKERVITVWASEGKFLSTLAITSAGEGKIEVKGKFARNFHSKDRGYLGVITVYKSSGTGATSYGSLTNVFKASGLPVRVNTVSLTESNFMGYAEETAVPEGCTVAGRAVAFMIVNENNKEQPVRELKAWFTTINLSDCYRKD
ncbi:hypothetical protein EZS27_004109 [termite gut metagenome]|uniref:Uncharacterized protein n=1 Tax=termite gut metagenome TaxID=433724 RepID=A0A5J4SQY1_9ZZZZ